MATLVYHDGFEHGLLGTGNAGPYDSVATGAIVTTPVRTGVRAYEASPAGAAEQIRKNFTASNYVTSAFYLRFATLPSADVILATIQNASGTPQLWFDSATGKLELALSGSAPIQGGPVLSTGQWYRVVLESDSSGASTVLRCKVDNGTEFTTSRTQATATQAFATLGTNTTDTAA